MVMMIMMNKNFNCFVFRAGRYLQAGGRLVCLATPGLLVPTGASGGARTGDVQMGQDEGWNV